MPTANMKNKYINKYSDFLFEQDMMAGMGTPPVAAAPKKIEYEFLFMIDSNDAGNHRRKYPDGSIVIEYPCYSIDLDTLTTWTKDNIVSPDNKLNNSELEIRRQNLIDIVKGDKQDTSIDDLPIVEKFKNAVAAKTIDGVKYKPDVTVTFSDGVPTTDNINVTFIKRKNDNKK